MNKVTEALKEYLDGIGKAHRKGVISNAEYILATAACQVAEFALTSIGNNCNALAAMQSDKE